MEESLVEAAKKGRKDEVERLLAKGADINEGDEEHTPLTGAAWEGHLEIIKFLLDQGADIDAMSPSGSVLMVALEEEHDEIVRYLVSKGADVNAADETGKTPLLCSDLVKHVRLLLQMGADVNTGDEDGNTPLAQALNSSSSEVANLLLQHGADPNVSSFGMPLIMMAIAAGKEDLVEPFVEAGADLECSDENGMTPLLMALEDDKFDLAKALIRGGADVNKMDVDENTPLMLVTTADLDPQEKEDLINVLAEYGADINFVNSQGQSAIHAAVMEDDPRLLKQLLQWGAVPTTAAKETARGRRLVQMTAILEDKGTNFGEPVKAAASVGGTVADPVKMSEKKTPENKANKKRRTD